MADSRFFDRDGPFSLGELARLSGARLIPPAESERICRDVAPLVREWAEAGRAHAGCILIWTLDHSQFAEIVSNVERLLAERPRQQDWRDLTEAF